MLHPCAASQPLRGKGGARGEEEEETLLICRSPVRLRGARCSADSAELGCGTGLAGIVAARMGARQVFLTDFNPPVVQNAEYNIRCVHN